MKGFLEWLKAGMGGIMQYRKGILYGILAFMALYFGNRLSWLYGLCYGDTEAERFTVLLSHLDMAFAFGLPSKKPADIGIGVLSAMSAAAILYIHDADARKYRHGTEFGSARWGTRADISVNQRIARGTNSVLV